jgi:formylglycine-generating enzyme required for sulfatase activity
MEVVGNTTSLSPEILAILEKLSPEKGSIFTRFSSGKSGAIVLVLDIQGRRDEHQGPHVVKIQNANIGGPEQTRHLRAKQTSIKDHIPALVDLVMEGPLVAALYEVAGRHLLNIEPLSYLVRSDVARAIEYVSKTADLLKSWNPADHLLKERRSSQAFEILRQTINLSKERLEGERSISEILAEIVPKANTTPSLFFENTLASLPNPIAYAYNQNLWNESQLIWPEGYLHADLHSENIICNLGSSDLLIIDWASFEEHGLALFDWAYLEIDLLLRYLPCNSWEDWAEWIHLTEQLCKKIVPDSEPKGHLTPMAWHLVRPLREGVDELCKGLPRELTEWFEISFWISAVAAALNFARKSGLQKQTRTAILLYASRCLDRVLYQLQIPRPPSPPTYVDFPRETMSINWEEVGLISQQYAGNPVQPMDIFLSFESQDNKWAERIAQDLSSRGFSLSYDNEHIKGGDEWIETITRGINIAPIFITLVSSSSNMSGWTRREFLYAESKRKHIIAVQIDECDLPTYILEQQVIEVHSDYALGLKSLIGSLPKPLSKVVVNEKVNFDRRLLEQAYLDRLLFKYDLWRELYTPMVGASETVSRVPDVLFPLTPSTMSPLFELLEERSEQLGGAEPQRSYKVTDIISDIQNRKRVVLLGDPGAGKSTTLWNLVAELARDAQQNERAVLPLLVPLGGYVDDGPFIDYIQNQAETLLGELSPYLPHLLNEKRIAILLDGLNEMPRLDFEGRIRRVKSFLDSHLELLTVVTCRELDYTVDLRLDKIRIFPLDPIRIKAFLRSYLKEEGENLFWKLIEGKDQDRVRYQFWKRFVEGGGKEYDFWLAQEQPTDLTRPWYFWDWQYWLKLRDNPRSYMAIARNPYMLWMITQIYARQHHLPTNRGQLFRLFVDVLMAREKDRTIEENWIDEKTQLEALSKLAYVMQKGGQLGTSVDHDTALKYLGSEKMLHLAFSENLLEIGDRIRFTHQLLQEFFAAYALDRERLKGKPATDFWPASQWWNPVGWEETSVLMAGLYVDDPISVLNWLRDANPELAARCLVDGGIPVRDAVRQMLVAAWLPRLTDLNEPVNARSAIGRALGLINADTRPGICLIGDDDLPVIEWCDVPAGTFLMGEGDETHTVHLPYYQISKYLITNAQYDAFINDQGFTMKWRHCWTDAGWVQKGDSISPEEYREILRLPNHPRIGLMWYDAVAFCRWLDIRMKALGRIPEDLEIRLPTEAEWEKAARGVNGQAYPWSNEFDTNKCNVIGIESTTAVGIFPDGASPFGVLDMIGNAWKWCLTKWRDDPIAPEDNDLEGNEPRVYRGGSWGSNAFRSEPWNPNELHCGRRYWNVPEDNRPDAVGFFIVLGPALT